MLLHMEAFTSDDAAIIIVNNNDDEVRARIPAWEVGLGFDDDVEQLLVTFEAWIQYRQAWLSPSRMAGLILD